MSQTERLNDLVVVFCIVIVCILAVLLVYGSLLEVKRLSPSDLLEEQLHTGQVDVALEGRDKDTRMNREGGGK